MRKIMARIPLGFIDVDAAVRTPAAPCAQMSTG